jgi:riboflavin kinase / FMN adenylyltransferase
VDTFRFFVVMTAYAIGKFDALHRGHFALAERARELGPPCLLGFSGMAEVLGWPARRPLIAPTDRARVLAGWSLGLDHAVREIGLPFAGIRGMDPAEFISHLRTAHGATALVVGEDFRFGRDRSGDAAALRALAAVQGLRAEIVAPVLHAGEPVSSSRVRAALAAGDVALASAMLGRPHRLVGTVVRGDGRGRKLGIPTANLGGCANQEPAVGVYAAWATIDGKRVQAAVNIGHVPTIGGERPLTVEAHLIGWSGDCYGRELGLDLIAHLRGEHRFATLDALVAQIRADIAAVNGLLESGLDRFENFLLEILWASDASFDDLYAIACREAARDAELTSRLSRSAIEATVARFLGQGLVQKTIWQGTSVLVITTRGTDLLNRARAHRESPLLSLERPL